MATLMLVDDNRALLDLTMLKLRRAMPGVTIVAAHTCEDARRLAGTLIPDVAVIERLLPDGDGLSLSWELSERFPGVRMILLSSAASGSGDGEPEIPQAAVLGKPYDLNDIVTQVRAALHASRKALSVPTAGEAGGRPMTPPADELTRRHTLGRLSALLDGLRALGADVRAQRTDGGRAGVVDQRLDALIAAVQDIIRLNQSRDPGN